MVVAGVVVLGAIMSILDITVVGVAQRTFQETFDATQAQVAWTMTGYTLALATVIPLTGWAADRFGTKRLYMLAVVLFTAGSALCATADQLEMLVAFRVLQGLGGGMLMPLGMTIMTRAAGPERLGRVMAILGVPMLLGPIFGPILGGWLIDIASWHWIFLINVPIGIVALVYAWRVLDRDDGPPVGELRLRRHAAALAGPGAVPVRRLARSRPRSRSTAPCGPTRCVDHRVRRPGCWSPRSCPGPLRQQEHPPAGRPAPVPNRVHDRRGDHDVAVRDRVLRRQPAVPALLPAGARRDPAGVRAGWWPRRASARC